MGPVAADASISDGESTGDGTRAVDSAVVAAGPRVLPVIYLDVPGKAPETLTRTKVPGSMKIIEDHNGTHGDLAGRPVAFQHAMGISIRGSSSQGFDQKSFSIELWDAARNEVDRPVLGMPADGDWALVACWADKACMRNLLAYAIGRTFGRWNPRARLVEVYFNSRYVGLYQFVEPPRHGKNRVGIPRPAPSAALGDITGGYMIRREAESPGAPGDEWISPVKEPGAWPHQIIFTHHFPKIEVITEAQKTYIRDYFRRFEEMMAGPQWNHPTAGYRAWIDLASWVDYAVINELTANIDAYFRSMYMTKESDLRGGKLFLTPIWDFNFALGNADIRFGWKRDGLTWKQLSEYGGECTPLLAAGPPYCTAGVCCRSGCALPNKCWNDPIVPFWWLKIWSDPAFRVAVKCRWRALRAEGGPLSMGFIDTLLAAWKQQILPGPAERHFARYPKLRGFVWPNPYYVDKTSAPVPGDSLKAFLDKEVAWMRKWIDERAKWLDAGLPGACSN